MQYPAGRHLARLSKLTSLEESWTMFDGASKSDPVSSYSALFCDAAGGRPSARNRLLIGRIRKPAPTASTCCWHCMLHCMLWFANRSPQNRLYACRLLQTSVISDLPIATCSGTASAERLEARQLKGMHCGIGLRNGPDDSELLRRHVTEDVARLVLCGRLTTL